MRLALAHCNTSSVRAKNSGRLCRSCSHSSIRSYLSALPADVTGTTFRLKLFDMIAAGRVVVPDLNGIALVGDPLNTLVPYRHMQDEIPAVTATGLQIIDLTGMPMREVRARVANLPARTAILYPGMYSDGEGTYLTPVEGLRRFADAANRPIIVTAETQLWAWNWRLYCRAIRDRPGRRCAGAPHFAGRTSGCHPRQ